MRVLLDECVNQRLRNYLPGHECESAEYAGFAGLKNGELLDAAESAHFDVLLTVDRGTLSCALRQGCVVRSRGGVVQKQ